MFGLSCARYTRFSPVFVGSVDNFFQHLDFVFPPYVFNVCSCIWLYILLFSLMPFHKMTTSSPWSSHHSLYIIENPRHFSTSVVCKKENPAICHFRFLFNLLSEVMWKMAYKEQWHFVSINTFSLFISWFICHLNSRESDCSFSG